MGFVFELDDLFFGLIGESGVGKTNELCSLVISNLLKKDKIALFYKGVDLWDGLTARYAKILIGNLEEMKVLLLS